MNVARAAGLVLALAGGLAASAAEPEWRPIAGSWSASGTRHAVPVEGLSEAVAVELSGAIVLADGSGLSRGFLGRAVAFHDGQGLSVGRAVWTDAEGDRIFSRLEGEPLQTGRRWQGIITGGTGRYAGLEGEYSLVWQYVVPGEDGRVQGRAVKLTGQVRRTGARP